MRKQWTQIYKKKKKKGPLEELSNQMWQILCFIQPATTRGCGSKL